MKQEDKEKCVPGKSSQEVFDGLVEAIAKANDPPQTDGCNEAVAHAAIDYLASVDVDAGPEPAAPLPWEAGETHEGIGWLDSSARGDPIDTDNASDCRAIAHRVNNWNTLRAALAATRAACDRLEQRVAELEALDAQNADLAKRLADTALLVHGAIASSRSPSAASRSSHA